MIVEYPPFPPLYYDISQAEKDYAWQVACARHNENRRVGRHDAKVNTVDGERVNYEGCLGETAISNKLKVPWSGRFFRDETWQQWRYMGHDVGPYEVRATVHQLGRLMLHGFQTWKSKPDNPYAPYILVRLHRMLRQPPQDTIEIIGWYWGNDGMWRADWWDKGKHDKGAVYVPTQFLRSMTELEQLYRVGVIR